MFTFKSFVILFMKRYSAIYPSLVLIPCRWWEGLRPTETPKAVLGRSNQAGEVKDE